MIKKSDLRDTAILVRAGLGKQLSAADAAARAIKDHFFAEFSPAAGVKVSGYWPISDEVDDRPVLIELHDRRCQCLLPVVTGAPGNKALLEFRAWEPGLILATSDWGIGEPGPDRPAHAPEIVLAPLLAFDDEGWRLGYGGGYYDRSLAILRERNPTGVTVIGLAYSGQRVDTVPHNDHDQRLDYIITEAGVS